jgi:hypothetical protein
MIATDIPKLDEVLVRGLNVIWERELLTNGCGICHGIAGNGYAFLTTYQHFPAKKEFLQQAVLFALDIIHQGVHECCRQADHPYSLFEGLAGAVQFILDVIVMIRFMNTNNRRR